MKTFIKDLAKRKISSLVDVSKIQDLASKSYVDILVGESEKKLLKHQIATKWSIIDAFERMTQPKITLKTYCPLCEQECLNENEKIFTSNCIFGGGVLTRYQCPNCDVIYGPNKMLSLTDEELSQEYEWHYSVYEEGDSTKLEIKAFYELEPSKDKVYLNYGGGAWSKSLEILREEGWQIYCYEPHAHIDHNQEFVIKNRKSLLMMKFDGIFSNNVLEHFRFPVAELKDMLSLLKQDGKMAHATPCYEYAFEFTRFHLFFFTGRSKNILWNKAGLRPLNFSHDGVFMCQVLEAIDK